MTRKDIEIKIEEKTNQIKELKKEIHELKIEELLYCDDQQQYYEKEVEVVVKKRPKVVEKQVRGFVTWKEQFKDEDTGECFIIDRNMLVRINGIWI